MALYNTRIQYIKMFFKKYRFLIDLMCGVGLLICFAFEKSMPM